MEIQGKDVDFYVSTNLVTPDWKKVICLETLTVDWSMSVNKRRTRCGTKVGVGDLEVTMNGTFIADDAPATGEISHKELEGFMNGATPVLVKAAHATNSKYFVSGTAYFTQMSESFPSDDAIDVSWTADLTGDIDLVP